MIAFVTRARCFITASWYGPPAPGSAMAASALKTIQSLNPRSAFALDGPERFLLWHAVHLERGPLQQTKEVNK